MKVSRTRCPGPFGATMLTSTPLRRLDRAEANVEPVREHQRLAGFVEVRRDVALPDRRLRGVGREHHQDIAPGGGVRDARHRQPRPFGLRAALARLGEPNPDVDAALLQVQRVRVPLRAVADDGHLLRFDELDLRVRVVMNRRHGKRPLSSLKASMSSPRPCFRPRLPLLRARPGCGLRGVVGRSVFVAARHRHGARPHQLDDPVRAEHLDEPVDLVHRAGDLDHQRLRRDVDHPRAEHFAELHDRRPHFAVRAHLDQRELAHDRRRVGHVLDREHVDELVEVRLEPSRGVVVGADDERHPRHARALGATDGEGLDVEAAAAKERSDAVEDAGAILQIGEKGTNADGLHSLTSGSLEKHIGLPQSVSALSSGAELGRRIMSCRSAPAGTIG